MIPFKDDGTIPHVQLLPPPAPLTDGEQTLLAQMFGDPLIKKYLQLLIWNTIIEHSDITLQTMHEDGAFATALKQAYVKGNLSMLYTLNTIQKPQPISVQATQQGQQQQR